MRGDLMVERAVAHIPRCGLMGSNDDQRKEADSPAQP